jgi:outer membrane lipopolysaccharide assembly protein LptE/RlpB
LFKNEVLIDVIGNVGEDPGSAWTVAGVSNATVDKTLVRKAPVEIGTTDWALSAGTNTDDSQWLVYAQDEVSYLGSHVQAPDTEGPVATFEPLNNASAVFVNVHPTLTFNENVFDANGLVFADGADVSLLLECYETATPANTVAFNATISGRVITVIPDAALANSTQYTLVLKADAVQDKAGNRNLSAQTSFTTIDASVQSLSLTYPAGGEVFYAGDEVTLGWNAANISQIKVEVYVPRFDTWTELLASTDATTGSVALTVGADSYYGNNYKLRISAVDNAAINAVSGDFEIIAVPQTLATLRNQGAGAKVKFAGNATVTMVQSYRNQKFIQDATAAVLIDDLAGKITSSYTIGANMSGLEGSLTEYGGMLQLVPSADPGASSGAGTVIVPEVVTLDAFASDFEAYEAELLTFEDVTFSQADGSLKFATGTSYTLSDQTNTANFYTNFYDADYIGAVLPETTGNISGIAHSRTTGNYITARFATDLSFPSNDASLSAITLDGTPLDGFDSSVLTYSISLPAGTTEVPVLVATATDANASIGIIAATSLPGTTSITVTAQDGVTQQTYTVQFTVTPYNTDATLSSLSYNGTALEGFAANQYEYSVVLPYGTTTVPVIAAVAADAKANVVLTQATQLPGDASVKVTAEDNETTLTYTIHFSVALNNDATLSDILIDGQALAGFAPGTLEYVFSVSNQSIPVVSAIASDTKASLTIVQATAVPGSASIQVTAEDNTTVLTYKVTFVDASLGHDASLSSLSVDELPLTGFAPAVWVYEVELPYGTSTIPVVSATTNDVNASMEITQATQLPGEATVLVTAEDGGTQQSYTVKFSVAPNNDATLHGIIVNGEAISSFDANTLDYQVILPFGTTDLPVVAASSTDLNATLDITQAEAIPGTATIRVTAEDGQTQLTYSVSFTLAPNNDATISTLTVDDVLLEDFDVTKLSYKVELPTGTTKIPVVAATASDANALVDVVQASELPGTATITVTAEDGETQLVYTVEFTIRVDESYTVTFNVLDEDGNPVEGATVLFNSESKLTDVSGKAVYTEIMPVSEAPFSISKPEAFEEYQGTLSVVDADLTVDVVMLAVGINTEHALVSSIYPNPSRGEFAILLHQVSPGTSMTITDLRGRIVLQTELHQLETRIDLSQAKAGVYILRIQSSEHLFTEQILLAK